MIRLIAHLYISFQKMTNVQCIEIEELPPQITALSKLKGLRFTYVNNQEGMIGIGRVPRGITNLPCWSMGRGNYYHQHIHGIEFFEVPVG